MREARGRGRPQSKTAMRCAIYTRKSNEDGLEQDFNSLDAQREACAAYIASQKSEGWTCLPDMYDDGGISGGTMERPALKRLLHDIAVGAIDAVVVYKVDRLTRSLSDFARIVDVFDTHGVSFVSVTQHFNTTTSMGRLTLNVLLSFAQFEREVTGERIRDKIAASKKKGIWMGGMPPLGYDIRDRKLVINDREAETVRDIYRRYLAARSVRALKDELDRDGIVSKVRVDRVGRTSGGNSFARGALYLMLQNRIYRGEIVHKGKSYPGEHEAIVDPPLWEAVQEMLAANRLDHRMGVAAANPSLLAGVIFDDAGERMTPSHANRQGTRYRYYVSSFLTTGAPRGGTRGRRVPAGDLEALVEEHVCRLLRSEADLFGMLHARNTDHFACADLVARARDLAARWPALDAAEKRAVILALVGRIDVLRDRLEIHVLPARLPSILPDAGACRDWTQTAGDDEPAVVLSVAARFRRTGKETRLLIDGSESDARRRPDRSLHRVLAQAHRFQALMMRNGGTPISELAAEAGVDRSYFSRVVRLSFLAPEVVEAILQDRHPIDLTAKKLANGLHLPIAWDQQRAEFGIS